MNSATWNTWLLKRLTNKPHIYLQNGEWKVILRPDYDFQKFIGRRFDAHQFCQDRNRERYSELITSRFQ